MHSENTRLIVCKLRSAQIHVGLQPDNTTDPHLCRLVQLACGQLYGGNVYEKYAPIHTQQTRGIHPILFQMVHRLQSWPNIKTAMGKFLVLLGRVVLAPCAPPPVCAARRESANSHDSRPTKLQITPQVGL